MASAKAIALAQFLAEEIAKGKKITTNTIMRRARQVGTSSEVLSALLLEELRFRRIEPPHGLIKQLLKSRSDYQEKWTKDKGFKSYSDYLEKWAKDKGFKSHFDYQEKLAKDKFVSRFAALLEVGVPPKKAAAMVLPLTKKQFFPKKQLGTLADEAVAASKRKKLQAHAGK